MGRQGKSEKGMTLVELLAAITILGIVFLSILSILPQMTKSNIQTEIKLETMNEARVKLEEIKANPEILCAPPEPEPDSDIITYTFSESEYDYEIHYDSKDSLSGTTIDLCNRPSNEVNTNQLITLNQIHIEVFHDEKMVSESFGYIKQ